MVKEVLQNWVENGYVIENMGDNAWAWTEYAKDNIPGYLLIVLSCILYEDFDFVPRLILNELEDYNFDKNGFCLEDS